MPIADFTARSSSGFGPRTSRSEQATLPELPTWETHDWWSLYVNKRSSSLVALSLYLSLPPPKKKERKANRPKGDRLKDIQAQQGLFPSSVADVALKARSLHEHKQKRLLYKDICPLGQANRLKHLTTTKTSKTRRPANPPARLAFRQRKNKANSKNQKQQKTGPEPKQNTHKIDLP